MLRHVLLAIALILVHLLSSAAFAADVPHFRVRDVIGLSSPADLQWAKDNGLRPVTGLTEIDLDSAIVRVLTKEGRMDPAYYAATNGANSTASPRALCLSNPEVVSAAFRVGMDSLANSPTSEPLYLRVSPVGGRCAGAAPEVGASVDNSYSRSYLMTVFNIAWQVGLTHPWTKIGYIADGDTAVPPRVKLPRNIVVLFEMGDRNPAIITSQTEKLSKWQKVASEVTVRISYPWSRILPAYSPSAAAKELVAMHEAGATGWVGSLPRNVLSAPQDDLIALLLFDTSVKPGKVLDSYFTSAYEASGPAVANFFHLLESACQTRSNTPGYSVDAAGMEKAWVALMAAKQEAFGPPRERIDELEKEFKLAYLPARAYGLASSASSRQMRNLADLARAVADVQGSLEAAEAAERAYEPASLELIHWQDTMVRLLQSDVRRIRDWAEANLKEDEAEIALSDLECRLADDPWAQKANLPEILKK